MVLVPFLMFHVKIRINKKNMLPGDATTPQSDNVVENNCHGDAQSVPQVGSYQPTPPGSKFWIPKANKKPVEGTEFDSLEQALQFYKEYAREGGFEVRKGGQKNRKKNDNPTVKYFVCSREGLKPPPKNDKSSSGNSQTDNTEVVTNVIKRRKRGSQRCGCKAQLRLRKKEGNKYYVHTFFEKHNHSLVHENDYKYLRAARKLTFSKQQLLRQLSEANIGPTRAWKVMTHMYGGFENIGATDVECRNYRRGLDNFIGNRDAQMVVEKLLSRQEFFSDFSIEYKKHKNDKTLIGLFWADAQAKRNYVAFGDVVSFDATFRSSRYIILHILYCTILVSF